MKIGLVSNLYPPLVHGGAEIYVGRLAAALAQDHQVVVITTEPGTHRTPRRKVSPDGVVVYRLAPLNIAHLTTLPHHAVPQAAFRAIDLFHPQVAAAMREIVARERPDVIHIHNWVGTSLAAVLSSVGRGRFDRVPVAMTLHDYGLCCVYADLRHPDGHGCPPRLPCRIMTSVNRRITDGVGLAISPSHFVLEAHQRLGFFQKAEQRVLVNGITAAPPAAARAPKATFEVLYLGRVQSYKGPEMLIRAFRRLADPALRLHIAGTGPSVGACAALAGGDARIRFHGFVKGDALRTLMETADCQVLPSLWPENAPVSIQEAFASGPVVIASRIGGIPEMVRDGINGLLVEPGDEVALANAIARLRASPDLVTRLRQEALKTARLYDMAFHKRQLVDAYRSLIATDRMKPFERKAA
jgi:glycosyltransferase involved in cell wall biosynthesis